MNTKLPAKFTVLAQMNNLLDETLAVIVARVRLAGEDELDGPLLVMRQFHDVFKLLEDQRRAFGKVAEAPRRSRWSTHRDSEDGHSG